MVISRYAAIGRITALCGIKQSFRDLRITVELTLITIVFTAADTATLSYEYDFCPSTFSIGFDEDGKTRIFSGEAPVNLSTP